MCESWFSVRYAVEAGQIRGMTEETMEEFCTRAWDLVAGDKICVETKQEMKERIGRSPDLADWAAGIVEMARRKGFQISKLSNGEGQSLPGHNPALNLQRQQRASAKAKQLNYA